MCDTKLNSLSSMVLFLSFRKQQGYAVKSIAMQCLMGSHS